MVNFYTNLDNGIRNMARVKNRLLDAEALWRYAVAALAGRAQSTGELKQKLRQRAERVSDVDAAIARLKEYGYLNERSFAEAFTTARLENQGFGRMRTMRELRQRRVAPALAEQAVQKVYREVDEQALIENFIRRKFRTTPREGLFADPKDLASAYRRLLHAGFRPAAIIQALKKFAKDPDLLDQFEPPETPEE
jgi:regulatory protein